MPFIKGHKYRRIKPPWNKGKTGIKTSPSGRIPWNKGKTGLQTAWNKNKKLGPLTKTHKQKISKANTNNPKRLGKNNYAWKGTQATYRSIHGWIQYHLGTPTTCTNCKKTNLKAQQIQWANISGTYKRDLKDWKRLCVKCHRKLDKNRKTIKRYYDKNKKRLPIN